GRKTETDARSEVRLVRLVERVGGRPKLARVDIEKNVQVFGLAHGCVVLVTHAIAQGQFSSDLEFILGKADIELLLAFALAGGAAVDQAGVGKVADETDTAGTIGNVVQEVGQACVRVGRATEAVHVHLDGAHFTTALHVVPPLYPRQVVDVRDRPGGIRGAAAIGLAVEPYQSSCGRNTRTAGLTGNAGIRDAAGEADGELGH